MQPALDDGLGDGLDLAQLAGDELLPAEAGIDAHHEDEVKLVEHIIERVRRRRGIERPAGFLAERLDALNRAVEVRTRLRMHGDRIRARFGEGVEKRVDGRNHQMDVERLAGVRAERLHHCRPDGQVGHKMAVHHVDMDPVCAGAVDRAHFLAEPGEVGREDRGGDDRHQGLRPIKRV